ncbi:MAG: 50S ribosomal protein L21e [Candidatus Micrarchaeaceae archaeon]|jgi:large subunit ribosomal protein L21e|nr:50S ribosomal protein L21e [Candidatus Micrarchaeota archaeon]HII10435.1 50S ribosomal protein L21e [Candidatus Micrarchaeota archaeon]
MTKRSQGLFAGRTRHLARHHKPSLLSVSERIKSFKDGDMVAIVPKGNFKNIPHPRYRGKIGRVIERRGGAYVVELRIMNSVKRLTVPALHLKKM